MVIISVTCCDTEAAWRQPRCHNRGVRGRSCKSSKCCPRPRRARTPAWHGRPEQPAAPRPAWRLSCGGRARPPAGGQRPEQRPRAPRGRGKMEACANAPCHPLSPLHLASRVARSTNQLQGRGGNNAATNPAPAPAATPAVAPPAVAPAAAAAANDANRRRAHSTRL